MWEIHFKWFDDMAFLRQAFVCAKTKQDATKALCERYNPEEFMIVDVKPVKAGTVIRTDFSVN